jgi:hypothetical protein
MNRRADMPRVPADTRGLWHRLPHAQTGEDHALRRSFDFGPGAGSLRAAWKT